MTSLSFDNKVLIEQVRGIESPQAFTDDSIDPGVSPNFDGRLLHRAQVLSKQHSLHGPLSHAPRIWRFSNGLATLLAFVLGALASLSALSGGSTLNIYWLLLVLVGFNLLSMALWLAGVCLRTENLTRGLFSRASAWLLELLGRRETPTGKADRAWLACHLTGPVGKWRFSQITQQLWLVYLCAGLAALVLVLITRQYDFVWGTTLLSDQTFVRLTSALAQPLHALGFATPSAQQVLETRIGAGFSPGAEHRYNWAQFLIGALLLLGILPRLLLWVVSRIMLSIARRQYALDKYLPYYIRLRQQLLPMHGRSEIVDADTAISPDTAQAEATTHERVAASQVPASARWVAVELGSAVSWPPQHIRTEHNLGEVLDRNSLETMLLQIQAQPSVELAVAVMASRPPDRGLKRTIAALSSAAAHSWLVLIDKAGQQSISEERLAAWYRLARECNIPAENVVNTAENLP